MESIPTINADIKFWCSASMELTLKRDRDKLERENAPGDSDYRGWEHYFAPGIKIDTSKHEDKNLEEVWRELKLKN